MDKVDELQAARTLIEAKRFAESWGIIERYLREDPDDPQALVVANYMNIQAANYPLAYLFARRVTELCPRDPVSWTNLAQVCKFMQREKEGERAAKQGLSLAAKDYDRVLLYLNLASIYMDADRFAEAAELLQKALKLEPTNKKLLGNLGMCQLALHEWGKGWKNYHDFIGLEERSRQIYQDPEEPEWDGAPGQTVLLYGEQGLGDEICFASMVNDAIDRAGKLILNVDKRLLGLFKRSFPKATIYGNRDKPVSQSEYGKIDASLAMGQVGEFFRLSAEDFPAAPYLKPDPDRVYMWKALFAAKHKPVIGIAWTGGIWHTGSRHRSCTLEQLLPLFQTVDAHWVSLQYKDAAKEIAAFRAKHDIDLVQYPHGTLTQDYDDTAAMVASLDAVVAVPTAVVHLAGAIGAPCIAMKSSKSCWKFHKALAFHPHVELVENSGSWDRTIQKTAQLLTKRFRKLEAA
jgi:tetratricopeptide (TPR) repeat protein